MRDAADEETPQYGQYFRQGAAVPTSIVVDRSITAADPGRPALLTLVVEFLNPAEHGMADESPDNLLEPIRDSVMGDLTHELDAHCVARVSAEGRHRYFLYLPPGVDPMPRVKAMRARFSAAGHEWKAAIGEDPEWQVCFRDLLPAPIDAEIMENTQVVQQLEENGDALDLARDVDHHAYFATAAGRDAFLAATAAEGFWGEIDEPLDPDPDPDPDSEDADAAADADAGANDPDLQHGAHLVRADAVTLPAISAVTLWLRELAAAHGGAYDGWGCMVQSD